MVRRREVGEGEHDVVLLKSFRVFPQEIFVVVGQYGMKMVKALGREFGRVGAGKLQCQGTLFLRRAGDSSVVDGLAEIAAGHGIARIDAHRGLGQQQGHVRIVSRESLFRPLQQIPIERPDPSVAFAQEGEKIVARRFAGYIETVLHHGGVIFQPCDLDIGPGPGSPVAQGLEFFLGAVGSGFPRQKRVGAGDILATERI
ncbi:MAG TPA: hypothetical protein DEB40_10095 [Elusimicrobia bacterium]|nr:hypothetical protein [Elusimicrobiota bacterium]HBT62080.1 hypothetical protein [Elusimicrobiota bacterium]